MPLILQSDLALLDFYLRSFPRALTNFRIVKLAFRSDVTPARHAAAVHGDLVQNTLRSVLGPLTVFGNPSSESLRQVMFHPWRFVNVLSSR